MGVGLGGGPDLGSTMFAQEFVFQYIQLSLWLERGARLWCSRSQIQTGQPQTNYPVTVGLTESLFSPWLTCLNSKVKEISFHTVIPKNGVPHTPTA